MSRSILFCDVDDTLIYEDYNLKPEVDTFIAEQAQKEKRECVIASLATYSHRTYLKSIKQHLMGEFWREDFNPVFGYYRLSDGSLRKVLDDYEAHPTLKSLREKINSAARSIFDYEQDNKVFLRKDFERLTEAGNELASSLMNEYLEIANKLLVHKETGEPLDENSRYKNSHRPHSKNRKDLDLARALYLQNSPERAKSVMLGDAKDIYHAGSAPDMPTIVVLENLWATRSHVRLLLDVLFNNEDYPDRVFDHLLARGKTMETRHHAFTHYHRVVETEILNQRFILGRTFDQSRIVFGSEPKLT